MSSPKPTDGIYRKGDKVFDGWTMREQKLCILFAQYFGIAPPPWEQEELGPVADDGAAKPPVDKLASALEFYMKGRK